MIKYFLTVLFTYTVFLGYSQQVETDTVPLSNIKEAERLIDKYGSQATKGFNNLVEKVTPLAAEGFNLAVKMQIAEGVARLLPIVLFIIIFILLKRLVDSYKGKEATLNEDLNNNTGVFTLFVIYVVLLVITFLVLLITTYGGITRLIAPEWHAIKEIIELVK